MNNSLDSEQSTVEGQEEEEEDLIGLYVGSRNTSGQRHKRGFAILPNKDQYDGEYRYDRRHGVGLYVFKNGERYYGNYRCGIRSGHGKFIYSDGSIYEGNWRKNLKHGKGFYRYVNGDAYNGDWYKGSRHGVGIYTYKEASISFKATWRNGVQVGPCEADYGKFQLHGYWDYMYPQGPAVFCFNQKYILNGYFKSDVNFTEATTKEERESTKSVEAVEEADLSEIHDKMYNVKISKWYAQAIDLYDFAQLPHEPVPLPVSDSELSFCSLVTVESHVPDEKSEQGICEEEEEVCEPVNLNEAVEVESDNICDFDN